MSKQYGLIVPGSNKEKKPVPVTSVFGNDSDSEDERPKLGNLGPGAAQRKQARLLQSKALEEDPTIFQYDEVYDEMGSKRKESVKSSKKAEEKKPKYIGKLLETAEKRKREYERRVERQVQKERDAEGEMYKDKESFVTSAYKKKLEEMQQAEDEEKRAEYLESIGDVRKQGNLDGFYRHLYEQKLGPEEKSKKENPDQSTSSKDVEKTPSVDKVRKDRRQYRKRKSDDEEDQEKEVKTQEPNESPEKKVENSSTKMHLHSNLDADSDFSIDSSSNESSDEETDKPKESKKPSTVKNEEKDKLKTESFSIELQKEDIKPEPIKNLSLTNGESTETSVEPPVEKKPKINIWAKRTVGDVFDEAVKRYFERKAARSG